jgi:hypothetical protein
MQHSKKIHFIEVAQGAFSMEQNMYEIWAGFGLVGNAEIQKKMGHKYAKVKYFLKNIPASALKVA